MRTLIAIASVIFVLHACGDSSKTTEIRTKQKPLVDITNVQESVKFLCGLFKKLDDTILSDEAYRQLQVEVEALYLGLEFGVNAGFYSDEDILQVSDSLGCIL